MEESPKSRGVREALAMSEDVTPFECEGQVFKGRNHAFYWWLSTYLPAKANVDGVSLLAMYENNVQEKGMMQGEFLRYCDSLGLPIPEGYNPEPGYYETSFRVYLIQQQRQKEESDRK
jgi:hypothetical protein